MQACIFADDVLDPFDLANLSGILGDPSLQREQAMQET
jgi:hypothetical protein